MVEEQQQHHQETIHAPSTQPRPWETAPHSDELVLTQPAADPPTPRPTDEPLLASYTSSAAHADSRAETAEQEAEENVQSELLPDQIDIQQYADKLELTDLSEEEVEATAAAAPPSASSPKPSSLTSAAASAAAPRSLHPIESSSFLSNLTWWWVGNLFRIGKQRRLLHSDLLPPPREDESAQLIARWHRSWQSQLERDPSKCPSVWRTLIAVFGWRFFIRGLPLLVVSASKIGQSLLLRQLVLFLQWNSGVEGIGDQGGVGVAYFYAVLLFVCCIVQSLVQHRYFFNSYRTGGQTRIVLSNAIYEQALLLQTTHFLHTSTGGMTNLVAVDAGKMEEVCIYATYLYDTFIEVAVTLGLLVDFIGVAALVGMGAMFSLVPLQAYFSRLFASFRKQAVLWTDLRVKVVNEILQGASVVKLYSYEQPLLRIVTEAREKEFAWLRKANYVKAANMAIFFFSSPVINLLTFITYHQLGHTLSPADIFVTVSLFNACRLPVTNYLPYAVQSLSEARISIARIQHFMELGFGDQRTQQSKQNNPTQQPTQAVQRAADAGEQRDVVVMDNASFKWDAESTESAGLYNITLRVPAGQLTAIVGSIGSCKSSLLAAMLGEMSTLNGSWQVHARIMAYAAQTSWIFADTLRANVLLGRPMRKRRYVQTLYACCLIDDIALLPAGDVTVIGDKGVNLSGGQRARVALARAVYGDADLYLFDDCLAALDAVVAQRVFVRCMSDRGLLRGKTRVLVTHQTHFLYEAQQIVLLDNGRVRAKGTWAEMVSQSDVRDIMHVTGQEGTNKPISQPLSPRATHDDSSAATTPISPVSATKLPTVASQSNQIPLLSMAATAVSSSTYTLLPLPSASPRTSPTASHSSASPSKPAAASKRADGNSIMSDEVSSVGTVGMDVYVALLRVSDSWWGWLWVFFVLCVLMIVGQGVSITSDRWLAIWSSKDAATQNESLYENVYIGLVMGTILFGVLRAFSFFNLVLRGAHRLHARMFHGVLYSGMRWFESNPTVRRHPLQLR